MPTQEGQICRIINPMADELPDDVYLVVEDPSPYRDDANIYVANLRGLQRNIKSPLSTPRKAVKKNELTVVAVSLEELVASWNDRDHAR